MRVVLSAFVLLSMSTFAFAETPKATTQELPAALKALRPEAAKIVSQAQAHAIRGQAAPKFGPHHSSIKHPGNKYTGNRTGQDLGPGFGGLK